MAGAKADRAGETARFGRRREDVIHAASALINELGVKGTTFAGLARSVGLNATSITYYFDRKDKLVVAVFASTLVWLEEAAREAAAKDAPEDRLRSFISAHIGLRRRIRLGEKGLITALSEIRTLDEESQAPLLEQRRPQLLHRNRFGTATRRRSSTSVNRTSCPIGVRCRSRKNVSTIVVFCSPASPGKFGMIRPSVG